MNSLETNQRTMKEQQIETVLITEGQLVTIRMQNKAMTLAEASKEAFMIIEAIREGSIDPYTAKEYYGINQKTFEAILGSGRK